MSTAVTLWSVAPTIIALIYIHSGLSVAPVAEAAAACPTSVPPEVESITPYNPMEYPEYRTPVDSNVSWVVATGYNTSLLDQPGTPNIHSGTPRATPTGLWHDEYTNTLYVATKDLGVFRSPLDSHSGGEVPPSSSMDFMSAATFGASSIATNEIGTELYLAADGDMIAVNLSTKSSIIIGILPHTRHITRVGEYTYAADKCIQRRHNANRTAFAPFACACTSTNTSSNAGTFAGCFMYRSEFLTFQSATVLKLGYVTTAQGEVFRIVPDTETVSLVFVLSPADGKFSGGIVAHPVMEDTLWLTTNESTHAFVYRDLADNGTDSVVRMIGESNGTFQGGFVCQSNLEASTRAATLNWRTGEIFFNDGLLIRRLKGLWDAKRSNASGEVVNNTAFSQLNSTLEELPIRSVLCAEFHAPTRQLYMLNNSAAYRTFVELNGTLGPLQLLGNPEMAEGGCAVDAFGEYLFASTRTQLVRIPLDFVSAYPRPFTAVAGLSTGDGWNDGPASNPATTLSYFSRMFRVNDVFIGTQFAHGCIRFFHAATSAAVGTFAGKCGTEWSHASQTRDGTLASARFVHPFSISCVSHVSNRTCYVVQQHHSGPTVVRRMDAFLDSVTTIPFAATDALLGSNFADPTDGYRMFTVRMSGGDGAELLNSMDLQRVAQNERFTGSLQLNGQVASTAGPLDAATSQHIMRAFTLDANTGRLFLPEASVDATNTLRRTAPIVSIPQDAVDTAFFPSLDSTHNLTVKTLSSVSAPSSASFFIGVVVRPQTTDVVFAVASIGILAQDDKSGGWKRALTADGTVSAVFHPSGEFLFVSRRGSVERFQVRDENTFGVSNVVVGLRGFTGGIFGMIEGLMGTNRIGEWRGMAFVDNAIFASDSAHDCVMRYDAITTYTSFYACQCGTEGTADGTFRTCTMSAPSGLSFLTKTSSRVGYVVHSTANDGRVRKMSELWGTVTTLYRVQTPLVELTDVLAYPNEEDVVFVTNKRGVSGKRSLTLLRYGQPLGSGILASTTNGGNSYIDGFWDDATVREVTQLALEPTTGQVFIADSKWEHSSSVRILCCLKPPYETPSRSLSRSSSMTASLSPSVSGTQHKMGSPTSSSPRTISVEETPPQKPVGSSTESVSLTPYSCVVEQLNYVGDVSVARVMLGSRRVWLNFTVQVRQLGDVNASVVDPVTSSLTWNAYRYLSAAKSVSTSWGTIFNVTTRFPNHVDVELGFPEGVSDEVEELLSLPLYSSSEVDMVLNLNEQSGLFRCAHAPAIIKTAVTLRGIRPPVPASVRESTEMVAGGMALIGGMVANPTAVMVPTRLNSLNKLLSCQVGHEEPLGRSMNPLNWRFGRPRGAYYRGAIAGNGFLLVALFLIASVAALALYDPRLRRTNVLGVMSTLHLPGIFIVPVSFFIGSSADVATALAIAGRDPLDPVIASMAYVTLVAIAVISTLATTRFLRATTKENEVLAMATGGSVFHRVKALAALSYVPSVKWVDKHGHRGFTDRWKHVFMGYKEGKTWYFGVELVSTALIGMISGGAGHESCDKLLYGMLVVLLLHAVSAVVFLPMLIIFDGVFHIASSSLTFLAALVGAIGAAKNDNKLIEASITISLVVSVMSIVKASVDVLAFLRSLVEDMKKWKLERAEKIRQKFSQVDADARRLAFVDEHGKDADDAKMRARLNDLDAFLEEESEDDLLLGPPAEDVDATELDSLLGGPEEGQEEADHDSLLGSAADPLEFEEEGVSHEGADDLDPLDSAAYDNYEDDDGDDQDVELEEVVNQVHEPSPAQRLLAARKSGLSLEMHDELAGLLSSSKTTATDAVVPDPDHAAALLRQQHL